MLNKRCPDILPLVESSCHGSLQEKSELETDNSVSNLSGNGIPDGLETEFLVFKTLVSNCVRLNSVSN